jgi:hypothetical protein
MLTALIAVALVLWILGTITSHTFGGGIHLLLLLAAGLAIARSLKQSRDPLRRG